MGLESVELLLAIEKEFDVAISDEDAGKIYTVGQLYDWLKNALQERTKGQIEDQRVWSRLVQVFVNTCGLGPEKIIPSARIVQDLGIE